MSSGNRPRPRPRPKPKAPSEHAAPAVGPSSSDSTPKPVQIQVIDSDEMFMRNRNRTSNTWARLEKLTKEVNTARDSDNDEEISTPRRKKAKQKKDEAEPWQNKKHINRLLSEEMPSSDEEDGVEIVGMSTTPRAPSASQQKRSRSRSITPPSELPRYQIQHMRALVEQTLNAAPSPPTRSRDDDIEVNDDALFTNPELAKLAKSVKSHASSEVRSPVPEERDTVQVAVRWKPHPLNPEGREALWLFKMNRDDNFQDLFEAAAEEACIRVDNLILTYEGRRIYASVTPMAFQMWGEVELVGCDKVTHEYLRTHPTNAIPEILSDIDAPSPSHTKGDDDDDDERAQDSEAEGETFKLILRSSLSTKDITLTVRPTTKCGAIVKAYLKKAGLADRYPGLFDGGKKGGERMKDPRLCIDGDKMGNDVEIGDADLEDGDMIEVVGL